jgi:hypothetical protein
MEKPTLWSVLSLLGGAVKWTWDNIVEIFLMIVLTVLTGGWIYNQYSPDIYGKSLLTLGLAWLSIDKIRRKLRKK